MINKVLAVLTRFHRIRPPLEQTQDELIEWLAQAHTQAELSLKMSRSVSEHESTLIQMRRLFARFACDSERIGNRGTEVLDASSADFSKAEIYRIEMPNGDTRPGSAVQAGPAGAGMFKRTQFFSRAADRVFREFYPAKSPAPAHIVHVTCTGYSSPSAAQSTVDRMGWSSDTAVTHAYHMGCYASIPAIRMAAGLALLEHKTVDVVHTEMCSLHMNPLNHSPEQIVVYSLFGDGHIKYSVEEPGAPGLEVLAIKEFIIPGTQDHMSWNTSDSGMQMTLSKDVPGKVGEYLATFLQSLLGESESECRKNAVYAVHPGGPKIIDSTQRLLGLEDWQVAHSKRVLYQYGNMSSATLPHIWQALWEDPEIKDGQLIVSLAFGPGLTIFGAVLRKVRA
ncbi:MAG: 3-oxoacyl-[acyl-carrier-protein] synthase III C-terminal domain-containing protein [Bdellovibrionota bacterium]